MMMRHFFATKFMEHIIYTTSIYVGPIYAKPCECNISCACKLINRVCFSKYCYESLKGKQTGKKQRTVTIRTLYNITLYGDLLSFCLVRMHYACMLCIY